MEPPQVFAARAHGGEAVVVVGDVGIVPRLRRTDHQALGDDGAREALIDAPVGPFAWRGTAAAAAAIGVEHRVHAGPAERRLVDAEGEGLRHALAPGVGAAFEHASRLPTRGSS
jgi:hypothetical protein